MSLATLRPNSTISNTGSVSGAGGDADLALSDNSDATSVNFDAGELFRGGLDNIPFVAGAITRRLALRVRVMWLDIGGGPSHAVARTRLVVASETVVDANTVVSWVAPTTINLGAVDGLFTDADVDGAELILSSESGILAVFEAYVDATYVAVPTVAITGPTGPVTDNDTPPIVWAPTLDSDGGPQTHFRAVYMANGQHPDSATPVADSGIVASAATSWTPDDAIANGTYDLYVKVAQTVNGVQHWSAWDDQQDVILNTPAPAAPFIALTPEPLEGRIRIDVTEGAGGSVITDRYRIQRSDDGGTTWADIRTVDGGGSLGAPHVVATGTFSDSADGTTHNASLPAPAGGILTNDLLIAFVAMDGNPTVAWPSGWTEIKDQAGSGSAVRVAAAWKRAEGGESGTVAITTSLGEGGGVRILCIRDADPNTAPAISTGVSSAAANANPDSLNPAGWGTENTLWIAAMGLDGNVAVTAGPADYFEFGNTRWANASGAGIATALRRTVAASEDPGAFTNAAEDSRAFTVGVRPAQATPGAYDYEAANGATVSYRVQALHDFPIGTSSRSAWASEDVAWASTSWWIKSATDPTLNLVVPRARVTSQPGERRPVRQGVHRVLDRPDAVVTRGTRDWPEGEIRFELETPAEKAAMLALLEAPPPLLVQAPATDHWPDRWVAFGDADRARLADMLAIGDVTEALSWTEVRRPTDNLLAWPT